MDKQPTCKITEVSVFFTDSNGVRHDSGLCERNLNLLAHAQAIELDIGSLCGGHGKCGGDRIQILSGADALSPLTPAEAELLSPQEIQSGWRLGCQCFPNKEDQNIQVKTLNRL